MKPGRLWLAPTVALGLLASCATPGGGPVKAPPYSAPAARGDLSPAAQKLDEWRRSRVRIYMDDFGELGRYRAANGALKPPATGESRVVFYGDSITDLWPLALSFPGEPYVNRGISGQTTAQMLVRFRPDVIALDPKVVVILAGTNDIAGNTGPMTLEETEANLASMVELARAHGIRVVLSSVLPVHHYTPMSEMAFPLRPPEKIAALNSWLQAYAARSGSVYLDYASAMTDGRGFLKRELAVDGLHPNRDGYAIMVPLAEAAIATALAAP
jgi:lysophospholipase L1-like esterase